MIIKFEVNGAWQIFDDVDSLMYRKLGAFNIAEPGESLDEVIDYSGTLHSIPPDENGFIGRVLLTFMNSKQTADSQVIAFSPIYLMNNNGRTIEIV